MLQERGTLSMEIAMQHIKIYFSILIFVLTAGIPSVLVKMVQHASLVSEARITKNQARRIALQRVPGTIVDGDLLRKHERIVYKFEIEPGGCSAFKVHVDAVSGEIISVKQERRRVGDWERVCQEDSDASRQLL